MGDLIYRDDAIVALTTSADYIGNALDKLCKIPAVDAAPMVHGRWGKDCDCSVCDFKPWYEYDIHTLSYCPNCGAKMDGE